MAGAGRGEPPSLCLSPKASLVPKLYAAPRGRWNPRRRRMLATQPLSTKPSNSPRPPPPFSAAPGGFLPLASSPSSPPPSSRLGSSVPSAHPHPRPGGLQPGRSPICTNLGLG